MPWASAGPRRRPARAARSRSRAHNDRSGRADRDPWRAARAAFSLPSNGYLTIVSSSGSEAGRIVGRVERKRNSDESRSAGPTRCMALQLSPDRALVLQLDARAEPPRRLLARIEHVTSGRVARIRSLKELTTFLKEVLG